MKQRNYFITFTLKKVLEKSLFVWKKTKKVNKVFFIPKSIILSSSIYEQEKTPYYIRDRITLELPRWYCKNALGFFR